MRDDRISNLAILVVSLYVLINILSQCVEPRVRGEYGEAPDYRD
jgi:hypothetical protein